MKYRSGFSVWALNGVRVPQWLAETPGEQLDCRKSVALKNVEQRREAVRKIGVERLVHKLGAKTIGGDGNYTLLQIDLGLRRPAVALKMLNPSVPELWHIEFVHDSCSTVEQALNWRNGLSESQIDDENGEEWYQQGDVIMRPKSAKRFRRNPKVLT